MPTTQGFPLDVTFTEITKRSLHCPCFNLVKQYSIIRRFLADTGLERDWLAELELLVEHDQLLLPVHVKCSPGCARWEGTGPRWSTCRGWPGPASRCAWLARSCQDILPVKDHYGWPQSCLPSPQIAPPPCSPQLNSWQRRSCLSASPSPALPVSSWRTPPTSPQQRSRSQATSPLELSSTPDKILNC